MCITRMVSANECNYFVVMVNFFPQPLVMHLACVNMALTMEESLVAATINAAASLGLSGECGSLERGKRADMLILSTDR